MSLEDFQGISRMGRRVVYNSKQESSHPHKAEEVGHQNLTGI
jgi:hypothetical protein